MVKRYFQGASSGGITQQKRGQSLCIYFLYLVGITLFTNKSATYMDVTYLKYFRDLDLVSDYAWGVAAMYRELNNASHYKTDI